MIGMGNYLDMGAPSYEGKQVYRGLDVPREFFVASCICDRFVVKQ